MSELQLPEGYAFTDEQLRAMVGKSVTGLANGRVVDAAQEGEDLVLTMEVDRMPDDLVRRLCLDARTPGFSIVYSDKKI